MTAGEIRALAVQAGIGPGVTVLDLCCGVGGPGRFLTRELSCDYLGVDASASAVAVARERAGDLLAADPDTLLVARAGSGFTRPTDLIGRRLALGSADSAHAAILPLYYLAREGVTAAEVELLRIDTDLGKHGDTGRSELDGIRAVLDDVVDAAAIGSSTWEAIGRDELMPGALEAFWTSSSYCHCNFTALDTLPAERTEPWVTRLLAMDWNDPDHRRILELEGLRRWVRPELDGYASLFDAVKDQGISAHW